MSGLRYGIVRHSIEASRWRILFYRCVRLFGCPQKARAVADADMKKMRREVRAALAKKKLNI